MKTVLFVAMSLSALSSVEANADECTKYFKNNNVVLVKDTSTARALTGLAAPGFLGALAINAAMKPGDEKMPEPSKNKTHLQLSQFLNQKIQSLSSFEIESINIKLN